MSHQIHYTVLYIIQYYKEVNIIKGPNKSLELQNMVI